MKIYPFTKEQKANDVLIMRKTRVDSKEFAGKQFMKLVDKHLTVAITLFTI